MKLLMVLFIISSNNLDQGASGLRISRRNQVVFSAFKKIVKLNMFNPPFTLLSVMIFLLILLGLSDHKKP